MYRFRMISNPFPLPRDFYLFYRWQSTRRRHSVPGGGRIVFAGDLYVKGWQLYKQGQTTAPLPSAGESPRRHNSDGKISMCNVRIIKYLQITIEVTKWLYCRRLENDNLNILTKTVNFLKVNFSRSHRFN